jgi:tetratricopeptide (TPR) repeat protein
MAKEEWEKAEGLYHQVVESTEKTNSLRLRSIAYSGLSDIAFQSGDYLKARKFLTQSLSIARNMGYRLFISYRLIKLADIAIVEGELSETEEYLQEALAITNYTGNPYQQANSNRMLGTVAFERGDFDNAETYFKESLRIYREIDLQLGIGQITSNLGNLTLAKGDIQEAVQKYHSAIQKGLELDPKIASSLFAETLTHLTHYFTQINDKKMAVELAIFTQEHPECHPYEKSKMTWLLYDLQKAMSEEDFAAAKEQGRERDLVATAKEMLAILEKGDLV